SLSDAGAQARHGHEACGEQGFCLELHCPPLSGFRSTRLRSRLQALFQRKASLGRMDARATLSAVPVKQMYVTVLPPERDFRAFREGAIPGLADGDGLTLHVT